MRFLKRMIVGYLVFVLYLWFAKWLEVLGVPISDGKQTPFVLPRIGLESPMTTVHHRFLVYCSPFVAAGVAAVEFRFP